MNNVFHCRYSAYSSDLFQYAFLYKHFLSFPIYSCCRSFWFVPCWAKSFARDADKTSAPQTFFGWVIMGKVIARTHSSRTPLLFASSDSMLNSSVTRFREFEQIPADVG